MRQRDYVKYISTILTTLALTELIFIYNIRTPSFKDLIKGTLSRYLYPHFFSLSDPSEFFAHANSNAIFSQIRLSTDYPFKRCIESTVSLTPRSHDSAVSIFNRNHIYIFKGSQSLHVHVCSIYTYLTQET